MKEKKREIPDKFPPSWFLSDNCYNRYIPLENPAYAWDADGGVWKEVTFRYLWYYERCFLVKWKEVSIMEKEIREFHGFYYTAEMQEIEAENLQETTRKIKLLRAKLNQMKREINEIKGIVTDLESLA